MASSTATPRPEKERGTIPVLSTAIVQQPPKKSKKQKSSTHQKSNVNNKEAETTPLSTPRKKKKKLTSHCRQSSPEDPRMTTTTTITTPHDEQDVPSTPETRKMKMTLEDVVLPTPEKKNTLASQKTTSIPKKKKKKKIKQEILVSSSTKKNKKLNTSPLESAPDAESQESVLTTELPLVETMNTTIAATTISETTLQTNPERSLPEIDPYTLTSTTEAKKQKMVSTTQKKPSVTKSQNMTTTVPMIAPTETNDMNIASDAIISAATNVMDRNTDISTEMSTAPEVKSKKILTTKPMAVTEATAKILTSNTEMLLDKEDKPPPAMLTDATPRKDHRTHTTPEFGCTSFSRYTLSSAESHRIEPDTNDFAKTKTPATYVKAVMSTIPINAALKSGIRCQKVTTGGRLVNRILTISNDRFALFITHHKVKGSRTGNGVLSSVASKLPLPFISRKGVRVFRSHDLREQYVRYVDVCDISFIHEGFPCTRKMEYSRTITRLKGKKCVIDTRKYQIVSIVHHGNDSLDVLIEDPTHRHALVETISFMMHKYQQAKFYVVDEARLLRYIWYDVDTNQDGMVSEKEFIAITSRINLSVRNPRQLYQDYRYEHHIKGHLTYRQCMGVLHDIEEGKYEKKYSMQSLSLWKRLFGDLNYVSAQDFLDLFLHPCQRELDATVQDVCRLFQSVNKIEVNRNESALPVRVDFISKTRFKNYLHHGLNAAFAPDHQVLNPDSMHRPLTEYWINTSHNTYLTGDQLQSISSVECYAAALRRGCKCLELDCYDGEKDSLTGEPIPIVYHGGTLTSKLLFEDIIEAVKSYVEAHPDTYPIILSLENHCSKPYQCVMVEILREFLGTLLYAPTQAKSRSKRKEVVRDMSEMPSPEALRGKVVIKGKRPPDVDENKEMDIGDVNDDDDPTEPNSSNNEIQDSSAGSSKSSKKRIQEGNYRRMSLRDMVLGADKKVIPKQTQVLDELVSLTLLHGVKFKSFKNSMNEPSSHMHSIGETKIGKILNQSASNSSLWRQYNTKHMTRTYPAGTRVDSSNYNPIIAWSMGCQLVALNFQTCDTPLLLNDGRFRQNGQCGYVLKPPSVLGFSPVQLSKPVTVKVRVLSGSCLPKPEGRKVGETIDPYVKVTIHDVQRKGDKETMKTDSYTTEIINDNGFCPNWDERELHRFKVFSPDVAMIHFCLMESDIGLDDKISHCVLPLMCMRQGYRSILMHDQYGTRTGVFGFATLLVEIQIE